MKIRPAVIKRVKNWGRKKIPAADAEGGGEGVGG